jgi:hypothetical protein
MLTPYEVRRRSLSFATIVDDVHRAFQVGSDVGASSVYSRGIATRTVAPSFVLLSL